jgi:hypothetical protein
MDIAIAFDRGFPGDGFLGFGDLFVDAAECAPGPVMAVLVVDHPIRDAADPLR